MDKNHILSKGLLGNLDFSVQNNHAHKLLGLERCASLLHTTGRGLIATALNKYSTQNRKPTSGFKPLTCSLRVTCLPSEGAEGLASLLGVSANLNSLLPARSAPRAQRRSARCRSV